jgi:predicted Rossmann-fold nucleotide-binding protein
MLAKLSLCVFCGSRHGSRPEYAQAAAEIGVEAARRGWRIVYGGGNVGLMGVLADAALESMHERKALMAAESSMFLAIPGGLGTLEELAEIWTWQQLALHSKPIGLLNVENFYDPLLQFLDNSVTEQFLKPACRDRLIVGTSVPELLDRLRDACSTENRTVDQPIPLEKT